MVYLTTYKRMMKRWMKPKYFFVSILAIAFLLCVCITLIEERYYRLPLQHLPKFKWCKPLERLQGPRGPVGLVSSPGSGNTWLRYLLQQATGIVTGSVYSDEYLAHLGFPGEFIADGSALVVKNHYPVKTADAILRFDSIVLLIRNPRDSILAEYNRRFAKVLLVEKNKQLISNLHNLVAPPSVFKRSPNEWSLDFAHLLHQWSTLYIDWLTNFHGPIHVIFYEDLVQDTEKELTKILDFLNITVTEFDIMCALDRKNDLDHIYRRYKKYKYFDPFTDDMYKKLNIALKNVYEVLYNVTGVSYNQSKYNKGKF